MTCENVREELEAYALGALEPAEARRIAAHLRECSGCTSLVRAYQTAVDYLALSVPLYRASPRLKDRIMGGVGAFRAPAYIGFLSQRWVAPTAAAVLLFLAIGAVAWAVSLSSEVSRLRTDNERLAELTQLDAEQRAVLLRMQGELSSARTEQGRMSKTLEEQATLIIVALDPDLIPSELQGTTLAPSARCNYVWSTKQSVGALTCKDLPSTAFALTYELWTTKGEKTVPVGTFLPRTDGSASVLVKFPADTPGPISNMWVTLEQQASTPRAKPSSEVVLTRSPDQQAAR